METDGGTPVRKHVRTVLVTADPVEASRWADAAREDVSLDVRCAGSLDAMIRILGRTSLDVAIVAASVPDGSYRDLLRALHVTREDLPAIVVGALDGDGIRDALALGALDVVMPRDLPRLGPAIARAVREAVLVSSLRRTRAELDLVTLERRDPVTGLPMREAFERHAKSALADCEREGNSLAVLFVDVDRFRVVNDLGDHGTGDTVLREIAARLREALPDAYVARFGGDEFVLLRCEDEHGAMRAAAETVANAFASPFRVAGKQVHLTASIGVAHAPEDASDVAGLIGTAETAVYEAKRLGRNMVRAYRSPGAASSLERVLTRRDLHGAIDRGEFELYYQPMYDIETRAIQGVEALLRWRHPVHGMVRPDRFIPIAEEFGLIEEIGAWVLERAVAQVRTWSDAGIPAVRVSVNVSARQLHGDALPLLVEALLEKYGVAASCLEIEITESSIVRDVPAALRLLHALRERGVRVSIDDFGTGYTSLAFLKRFPVDMLKIDRSFIADVARGGFDGAVVRAVTTLARGLGVRTVAEGVELQEQLDRLRTLDCDVVQGFLFSHPLPTAACTGLLAARTLPA
ncbi:MAG TPA: EAL domain-containing protein [Candidatus Elarobacter sp.]|nr:EAL domain-containing protein [Candidatus Elarobacter sp.]